MAVISAALGRLGRPRTWANALETLGLAVLACLALVPVCAVGAILFVYGYDFPDPPFLDERLGLLLQLSAVLLAVVSVVWVAGRLVQRRPVALRAVYGSLVVATLVGAAVGCATLLAHRGIAYIPRADWVTLWAGWLAWLTTATALLGREIRGREFVLGDGSSTQTIAGALLGLGLGAVLLAARVELFPCEGFVRTILWAALGASGGWLLAIARPTVLAPARVVALGVVILAAGTALLFRAGAAVPMGRVLGAATASDLDTLEACIQIPGNPDLAALRPLISVDDWFVRAQGAMALVEFAESKRLQPALVRALTDEHPDVREAAAGALGWVGTASASEALADLLDDPSSDARSAAASALSMIGGTAAESALRVAMDDPALRVRVIAIEALAVIDPERVLPQMVTAFEQAEPRVRLATLESLARMEFDDPIIADTIVRALDDDDDGVRLTAARALGRRREPSTLHALLGAAGDRADPVWQAAASAIEDIDGSAGAIAEGLDDTDPAVRLGSARVLTRVRLPEADPALLAAATDEDPDVRLWALAALTTVQGPELRAIVTAALDDPSGDVRRVAIRALPDAIGTDATPMLLRLLEGDVHEDRLAAVEALGDLSEALSTSARRPVIDALLPILEAVEGEQVRDDHDLALAAVRTLGHLEDPSTLPALIRLTEDVAPGSRRRSAMRRAALEALLTIGEDADESTRDVVERHMLAALEDPTIAVGAATGLGRIGSRRALDPLRTALRSDSPVLAAAALDSLAELEGPDLVDSLAPLVETGHIGEWSGDFALRHGAVMHLRDIGSAEAFAQLERLARTSDNLVSDLGTIEGLGQAGAVAIPVLAAVLDREASFWDFIRTAAARELVAIRTPEANALLYDRIARGNLEAFNVVRKQLVWPLSWKAPSGEPSDSGGAMLAYLEALQAREARRPERQARLAALALERLPADLGAPFKLLVGWLSVHARLGLRDVGAAHAEATALPALLDDLSHWDRLLYADPLAAETRYWLGKAVAASGEPDDLREAQTHHEAALEELRRIRRGASDGVWEFYWQEESERLEARIRTELGLLHRTLSGEELRAAAAIGASHQPRTIVELDADEERYATLARIALADGDYETAQRHLEELELRRMSFLSQRLDIRLANSGRQQVLEEFEQRTTDIDALSNRLEELVARSSPVDAFADAPGAAPDVASLGVELRAKRRELRTFVTQLRQERPEMAALLGAEPVDLAMVQTRLPANVALLQYLALPERLLTFVIRRTTLDIVETTVTEATLATKVAAFRTGIQSTQPDVKTTALAGELFDLMIGSVQREGRLQGVETLGIVPNGVLHQLPFAALRRHSDDDRLLVEQYNLFKVSSATLLWLALEQRPPSGDWLDVELLALSNPGGDLPNADAEVDGIAAHFERRALFSQADARKDVLENLRPRRRIVHLATHGILDNWDPTQSYLLMADDQRLTLGEAWGLPLEHTLLTVLSACDTGIGEVLAGDDVVSLESAFLYAGSSSVVATLWPVDDAATAALMQRFYASLASGVEKARALAEAQRWMAHGETVRWHDPYYWAGFSLQGAWN